VQIDPDRLSEGFREKAHRLGAQLLTIKIDALPDIFAAARQLGRALGDPAAGDALAASLSARIEAVREKADDDPPIPTILTLDERGETLIGPHTFLSDLLTAAGGTNAAAPLEAPYPRADAETLLALKPQAVILLRPYGTPDALDRARRFWSRLPNVTAARKGRVFMINDSNVLMPGSHVADLAEQIYRDLHPNLKSQISNPNSPGGSP
jgi:iron complex transport system substrate-binding protein